MTSTWNTTKKTGEVEAVPYEELTRILQELGFAHEYKEDIDKDNIFDVWANLNSGVLITIETWNQDGEQGYNSVKCYVPVSGCGFGMRNSTGFSYGTSYLSCFNIVHNTRDFPLHDCLAFNNGSMNWAGSNPALWHYGEGHDINYAKLSPKSVNSRTLTSASVSICSWMMRLNNTLKMAT